MKSMQHSRPREPQLCAIVFSVHEELPGLSPNFRHQSPGQEASVTTRTSVASRLQELSWRVATLKSSKENILPVKEPC